MKCADLVFGTILQLILIEANTRRDYENRGECLPVRKD